MSSRGDREESGMAGPDGAGDVAPELRIGVVLEAFLDWPLDRVLAWLRRPRRRSPISRSAPAGTPRTRTATSRNCSPARPRGPRGWT